MKLFYYRLSRLIIGLSLCAFGIAITINANIGYAPWEVFHTGLAKVTGLSIGSIIIITTFLICIIIVSIGEKIGMGTIFDVILVGFFLDFFLSLPFLPIANNLFIGIIMLFTGLSSISLGCYLYIGAGFGTGPRDALMVVLARKTKLPIGFCRGTIEFIAVLIGWILGGMVGVGTVLSAFLIGIFIQLVFKIFKFDATEVHHETIDYTIKYLLAR